MYTQTRVWLKSPLAPLTPLTGSNYNPNHWQQLPVVASGRLLPVGGASGVGGVRLLKLRLQNWLRIAPIFLTVNVVYLCLPMPIHVVGGLQLQYCI